MIGMTKSAAVTHGRDGTRVNAVCPGIIFTAMMAYEDQSAVAALLETIPFGRGAQPKEVSYGVLFLASDESSFVSGAVLPRTAGRLTDQRKGSHVQGSWLLDLAGGSRRLQQHYTTVHVSLAAALPYVQHLTTFKADESSRDGGIYRLAEVGWADEAACQEAMESEAWAAMVADAAGMMERFGAQLNSAMGWDDTPGK